MRTPFAQFGHNRKMGFLVFTPWVILIIAALGGVVMALWNAIIPDVIPSVQPIGFWQAIGLLVLCKILFGSFGHRHNRWHQRWDNMSDEEREKMRERFKNHWRSRHFQRNFDGHCHHDKAQDNPLDKQNPAMSESESDSTQDYSEKK